jgi:uncharacterized OB-fold protein
MTAEKPLPLPDASSQGFWEAASRHVLAIQRCGHCGILAHPPRVVCANCLAPVPSWSFQPVSGRATVRTWTVMRQSFLPGFQADVPYVIVEAELEEQKGLRLLARLVGRLDGPEAPLKVGSPVEAVFEDAAEGFAIPHFKLAGA